MNVILTERIRNLGVLGETVRVKAGFARNYLVPKGKAVYATKDNLAKFEMRRAELEKLAADKHQAALQLREQLLALPQISLRAKAGEEGKIFGSIGTRDIADAISQAGVAIQKHQVSLPEGTLRMLGDYEIMIELEADVFAAVKVSVVADVTSR